MSIRKVNFSFGEYYHLYNRGNSKQKIFLDTQDYLHFIAILYVCNSVNNFRVHGLQKKKNMYDFDRGDQIVSIGAYCLMPNHFHILITQNEKGSISKFMQKVSTAYSMYFNKKYKRTGGLFEGKFKSQHLNTDTYLKYIFSYIHLNPIKLIQKDWKENGIKNKKQAFEYLNMYTYSSYVDFLGKERIQNSVLDIQNFPEYFPTPTVFLSEIMEWLYHKPD